MKDALIPDDYSLHVLDCKKNGYPTSTIRMTARRSLPKMEEEWVTVECQVNIECAQNQESMNGAAELAFRTALGYTNEGMAIMAPGSQPIPFP